MVVWTEAPPRCSRSTSSFVTAFPAGPYASVPGAFGFTVSPIGTAMSPSAGAATSASTVDLGTRVPGDFTVAAWVAHRAWPSAGPIASDLILGEHFAFGLTVNGLTYSESFREIPGAGGGSGGGATSQFRHVALVYDTAAGRGVMYMDGSPTVNLPGDFSIGSTLTLLGDGYFDELRVYRRALTGAEIAALATL